MLYLVNDLLKTMLHMYYHNIRIKLYIHHFDLFELSAYKISLGILLLLFFSSPLFFYYIFFSYLLCSEIIYLNRETIEDIGISWCSVYGEHTHPL